MTIELYFSANNDYAALILEDHNNLPICFCYKCRSDNFCVI